MTLIGVSVPELVESQTWHLFVTSLVCTPIYACTNSTHHSPLRTPQKGLGISYQQAVTLFFKNELTSSRARQQSPPIMTNQNQPPQTRKHVPPFRKTGHISSPSCLTITSTRADPRDSWTSSPHLHRLPRVGHTEMVISHFVTHVLDPAPPPITQIAAKRRARSRGICPRAR